MPAGGLLHLFTTVQETRAMSDPGAEQSPDAVLPSTLAASSNVHRPSSTHLQDGSEAADPSSTARPPAGQLALDRTTASHSPLDEPPASTAQPYSPTTASPFAMLQWQSLHSEVCIKGDRLDLLRLWLQHVSVQHAWPLTDSHRPHVSSSPHESADHEMQDIFTLHPAHGIEHPALQDAQAQPLACHIQWKAHAGAAQQHQVSVSCGTIAILHVPGFVTDLVAFTGLTQSDPARADPDVLSQMPTAESDLSQLDKAAPHQPATEAAQDASSTGVSISVLAIGIGALSARAAGAHAVLLTCSRLSCHLGSIRAKGRPGSLLASLFAMQQGPQPEHGLRISAAEVMLGMVQQWQAGTDPTTSKPAGMQAISSSFEVQVLVQGWPLLQAPGKAQQAPVGAVAWPAAPLWKSSNSSEPQAATDRYGGACPPDVQGSTGKLISVAVSSIDLKLSGLQMAMLAAVADAATAETSRRFRQPLPQQAISTENAFDANRQAWLACLSLQLASLHMMFAPDDNLAAALAHPPDALRKVMAQMAKAELMTDAAADTGPAMPKWVLMCGRAAVILSVGPEGRDMPTMVFNLAMPHVWGQPGFNLALRGCDVSIMHTPPEEMNKQSKGATADTTSADPASTVRGPSATEQLPNLTSRPTDSPVAVISNVSASVDSAGGTGNAKKLITLTVDSVSVDVELQQLCSLVCFANETVLGPVVPVLPSYPPHSRPPDAVLHIHINLHLVFGQLQITTAQDTGSVDAPAPDLAFWLVSPELQLTKKTAQVVCSQQCTLARMHKQTLTLVSCLQQLLTILGIWSPFACS